MLIVQRQEKLVEILRLRRSVQLEELSRELNVSSSTIRRDLEVLEQQGLVERTHGGAVLKTTGHAATSLGLVDRMSEQVSQKQAIGRHAAALVEPQMTVLLDGGSTVVFAARQITARPLQVVTNSLMIAQMFADDDQVELVLVGGNLYPRTSVMVGPMATGCLADLHADILLFSLGGIFGDEAFNINLAMAQVEQAMIQQAARSVLLMDSTKFGRKSLVRVCGVNEINTIVTDGGVPASYREQLGERLVVVDETSR